MQDQFVAPYPQTCVSIRRRRVLFLVGTHEENLAF